MENLQTVQLVMSAMRSQHHSRSIWTVYMRLSLTPSRPIFISRAAVSNGALGRTSLITALPFLHSKHFKNIIIFLTFSCLKKIEGIFFNYNISIPKTLKMVVDTSKLNTQPYKVRIKGKVEQSREMSCALPYTSV